MAAAQLKRILIPWFIMQLALGFGCRTSAKDSDEVIIPDNPWGKPRIASCWVHASIAWTETLMLRRVQRKENLSESYMLYRHFEDQLTKARVITEVDPSGTFWRARDLMQSYGLMKDEDFMPGVSESDRTNRQQEAVIYMNNSLLSGPLSKVRSPNTIRTELNLAFGVEFDPAKSANKILWPIKIKVGKTLTVARELQRATEVKMPMAVIPLPKGGAPQFTKLYTEAEFAFMRSIMKNINNGYPVIVNWTADFAADAEGTFDIETLKKAPPRSGKQVRQSSLIEAYNAEGPDDKGGAFVVRDSGADKATLELAVMRGELTALILRNDWSGSDKPDEDGTLTFNGFKVSRLKASYMFGYFPEQKDWKSSGKATRGIKSVILMPKY